VIKYRLVSKRPGSTEWRNRNDLNKSEHDERNLAYMEAQKQGWQRVEFDTDYRIEKSFDSGRNWVPA
jgi:hypothetical protein